MKTLDIGALNKLYTDGEKADQSKFAEMRSNILLQSSEHYKKISEQLNRQINNARTPAQKIRLTKNHIQVITKDYMNGILANAPGVIPVAYNENELRDQKNAELARSVWLDAEEKCSVDEKIERSADNFVVIGEMAAMVYFNPNGGKFVGYKQATNEAGEPVFRNKLNELVTEQVDLFGQPNTPEKSDTPVFEGKLEIDLIHPFNLIRHKGCETLDASPFLCVRKMLSEAEAKALVSHLPDDEREEKLKFITVSNQSTFKVFDATTGDYSESKDQVQIREYYFRPGVEYPNGYFYITTDSGILFDGELPFGYFPIVTEGFDILTTSPRANSIIKPLRGPQAEINRMSSSKAQIQITQGKDKIITQMGSKISKGDQFEGADQLIINGPAPTVIPGRSGDQFSVSLEREIQEIYRLANLEYETKEAGVQDPYQQLFKSLAQKKKYVLYAKKFERFWCRVAKLYLCLAKYYLKDDYLVKAVGRSEAVNLAEFKNIADEDFNFKVKPVSGDIESMMGKQLNINTILQYAGKDLPTSVRGKLLNAMPFFNKEQIFSDLMIDDENITSDILALDRGEYRPAIEIDKHTLYIERLNNRMKKKDFATLPLQVQQMYKQKLQDHTQFQAQQEMKLKELEQGYWPTGGGLVKVDIYGQDGKRILLPQEALQKLVQVLEQQGSAQRNLQQLDDQNQIQILDAAQRMSQPPLPNQMTA